MNIETSKKIEIYNKAIENELETSANYTRKKGIKIISFWIVHVLQAKYTKSRPSSIHIINGNAERRLGNEKEFVDVFYGNYFNKISEIKNDRTVLFDIKFSKRFSVLIKSLIEYLLVRHKLKNAHYSYWLELNFFETFLMMSKASTIMSNGHYDRLTTFISLLCKEYKIDYVMHQHGLIGKIIIPNKIYCNGLIAFDSKQKELFKKYIVANDDCKYTIKYDNKVDFTNSGNTMNCIGFIDQPTTESVALLKELAGIYKHENFVVMLHPLSNKTAYLNANNGNLIFLDKAKELDLKFIISMPSTLAYDYIIKGYKGKILFYDPNKVFTGMLNDYNSLVYISDKGKLIEEINKALIEKSC